MILLILLRTVILIFLFGRHDGNAVTCDDFLAAMADANEVDLSQFARWYSTSGSE